MLVNIQIQISSSDTQIKDRETSADRPNQASPPRHDEK
jgi:hypothetical protein